MILFIINFNVTMILMLTIWHQNLELTQKNFLRANHHHDPHPHPHRCHCDSQDLELTLKNFLGPMREAGESLPAALRGKVSIIIDDDVKC